VPVQLSAVFPPVALQVALGVLDQVKVTGTPAVTVFALSVNATVKVPFPDKLIAKGCPVTLMFSTAVFDPAEAGSKTMLMVQVVPTATELPQVLVCENG
jgi:hypothetical protein